MNPDFWQYLFVMCRASYAPMRVLWLADQKLLAMDKLYYYVIQTDQMLLKYIVDAEERGGGPADGINSGGNGQPFSWHK